MVKTEPLEALKKKKFVKAKEMEAALIANGWKVRTPPKNQPHYYHLNVPDFVVVEARRGDETIQNPRLVKKYLKLMIEVKKQKEEKAKKELKNEK